MSAVDARRRADLAALERLAQASRGELVVRAAPAAGRSRIEIELRVPLAGSTRYPAERCTSARLAIDLPARYPFEPPVVRFVDGVPPHPNVFESGVVCIGSRWRPSEGLDLFVRRVARLLCFDPLLVNLNSLANAAAAGWYRSALRRHPDAFPTARIEWTLETDRLAPPPADAGPSRVIRACPSCSAQLRLPAGRHGTVDCPRCRRSFETTT